MQLKYMESFEIILPRRHAFTYLSFPYTLKSQKTRMINGYNIEKDRST